MNPAVLWLLLRPRSLSGGHAALQVVGSAVTTVLAFATAILATRFWSITAADGGYRVLAVVLLGLLLMPLVTLGTSSARLSARSRDDRLSTLRLLGLSARRVRNLAVAESTLVQSIGVLLGFVASLPLPLLVSLLPVQGRAASPEDLRLPAWAGIAIVVLVVAMAAISSLLGLRKVVLSPLGVRTHANAPGLSRFRIVIALVVLAGSVTLLQFASPSWGVTGITMALGGAVLAVMGILGVAGPFVLMTIARKRSGTTSDAATLVASRRNTGDPRAAWREVAGIALTSFVLVPAGSLLGFLHAVANGPSVLSVEQIVFITDTRFMLIALVVVSFVVAACQTATTQAASLLENRELYIALDRIGAPRAVMNRARYRQVHAPVLVAVIGSALAASALGFALVVVAITNSPVFVAVTAAILALGTGVIRLGVVATAPVLRSLLEGPQRGE